LSRFVSKKRKSLLIPYFLVGTVYCLIVGYVQGKIALLNGLKAVYISTTHNLPIESALWFLPALLWVTILYAFIDIFMKESLVKTICIILITITGCVWNKFFHYLPWGLNSAMSVLGFFALGHFYRMAGETHINNCLQNKNRNFVMMMIIIIMTLFGLLIMNNGSVNIRVGTFGFFPLAYLNAVVYILALFLIAQLAVNENDMEGSSNFKTFLINFLVRIGEISIVYVCFNHPVLKICRKFLLNIGLHTFSTIEVLLEFILAMLLIFLISSLIEKSPAKYVFYPKS